MPTCVVCDAAELSSLDAVRRGTCDRCAGMLEPPAPPRPPRPAPAPPPPRVTRPCARCRSPIWIRFTGGERLRAAGDVDAYACRGCGFVELYLRSPGAVPIGPEHDTELVDVTGDTPYR